MTRNDIDVATVVTQRNLTPRHCQSRRHRDNEKTRMSQAQSGRLSELSTLQEDKVSLNYIDDPRGALGDKSCYACGSQQVPVKLLNVE